MIQGPNVKSLIIRKMSLLMVPPGTKNALGSAIGNLSDGNRLSAIAKEATAWVEAAIAAVRSAKEPNPYKTQSDEEIAAIVLKGVEEIHRKRGKV